MSGLFLGKRCMHFVIQFGVDIDGKEREVMSHTDSKYEKVRVCMRVCAKRKTKRKRKTLTKTSANPVQKCEN